MSTVAELLSAAGRAHHQAFIETDGDDPEWPLWYAQYLQPRLDADHGIRMTVSELVHLLVQADRDHDEGAWNEFYARRIAAASG